MKTMKFSTMRIKFFMYMKARGPSIEKEHPYSQLSIIAYQYQISNKSSKFPKSRKVPRFK